MQVFFTAELSHVLSHGGSEVCAAIALHPVLPSLRLSSESPDVTTLFVGVTQSVPSWSFYYHYTVHVQVFT